VAPDLDYEHQKEALESFHRLLASAQEARRVNLLNNGFIPADKRVMIDAGLRCMPLIDESSNRRMSVAAAARLRALGTRLKLQAGDELDTLRALKEFDLKLKQHDRIERRNLFMGGAMVLIGLAILSWLLWAIINALS
jgi:hypothetical protein